MELRRWKGTTALRLGLVVIGLVCIPTVCFDLAYDYALTKNDPRDQLRQDISRLKADSSAVIGVSDNSGYFYTAMPAVSPLADARTSVVLAKSPPTTGSFWVVGFERPLQSKAIEAVARRVEEGGGLQLAGVYKHEPALFGWSFDLSSFPPDMTYPFPTLLLFRYK